MSSPIDFKRRRISASLSSLDPGNSSNGFSNADRSSRSVSTCQPSASSLFVNAVWRGVSSMKCDVIRVYVCVGGEGETSSEMLTRFKCYCRYVTSIVHFLVRT